MALATSRCKEITDYYLEKAGTNFAKNFDLIVTGDMIENGKPNPDIFLDAAKTLRISPENTIVIEDSPNGINAAVNGGIRAIMVPDLVEPDEVMKLKCFKIVRSLREVIDIIKNLNSKYIE